MTLNEEQMDRVRYELAPLMPQIARASQPERAQLVRQALERAGAQPTWVEWDAEVLGPDAALVRSRILRP